jgi:integral membrane protein (TIGR00529 family)
MVEALQALTSNGHIVIAALPSLVGLLPVVGGAMFSAPMVDEVGDRLAADQERKTFINYWFRHMWEPVYPLYPSMMLAAALLGLTTTQMAKAAWPLAVAAALGGLLFGLLGLSRRSAEDPPPTSRVQSLRRLATSAWPIVLFIVLSLTTPVDERISVILGLVVTIGFVMVIKHVPLRDLGTILRKRIPLNTLALIFGALVFRRVLQDSGAVLAVADGLTSLHIPLAAVAFGVPFIAGLLTGLLSAAYSIGFPVILPLVVADGGTIAPAWAAWLMAGGFRGNDHASVGGLADGGGLPGDHALAHAPVPGADAGLFRGQVGSALPPHHTGVHPGGRNGSGTPGGIIGQMRDTRLPDEGQGQFALGRPSSA